MSCGIWFQHLVLGQCRNGRSWCLMGGSEDLLGEEPPLLLTWKRQAEADYVSRSVVPYCTCGASAGWLQSPMMETTPLRMLHVPDTQGCRWHCSAPRYLKGRTVNPGGQQKELPELHLSERLLAWKPACFPAAM